MNVAIALLADGANQSREGKLNILGAFGNIYASSFPARHPEMHLVLRLDASAAESGLEKTLRAVLLTADGQPAGFGLQAKFVVPPPPKPGRRVQMDTVIRLVDVTFEKEGDYQVSIMIDGDEKATIPLTVGIPEGQKQ